MYIQTNLKQEFLSTTKYDGLIPLPKSEEPGKPTLDCRTLQLLFQWERAKKKQTKKAQKPNPTTEITENSLKILAEIKTAAKFYPFVLSPSIILMLYSFFFPSGNLWISRAEKQYKTSWAVQSIIETVHPEAGTEVQLSIICGF